MNDEVASLMNNQKLKFLAFGDIILVVMKVKENILIDKSIDFSARKIFHNPSGLFHMA